MAGFGVALVLTVRWPEFLPWAGGLTSGIVAPAVNLAVYLGCAWLLPRSAEERERVERLFAAAEERDAAPVPEGLVQPAGV